MPQKNFIPRTWKNNQNEQIEKIYAEIIQEAKDKGYHLTHRPPLFIYKSSNQLGRTITQLSTKLSIIGLNAGYLDRPEASRDTIVHELAHVIAGVDEGHSTRWKRIGNDLGKKWHIEVERTTKRSEIGIVVQQNAHEYQVECPKCKSRWTRQKRTNLIKHPEEYMCGVCRCKLVACKD